MWKGAVLYRWDDPTCVLKVKLPAFARLTMQEIVQKNHEYLTIEIRKVGKPRTTGEHSQNHAINGYCQQIARETGQPFESVKSAMKHEAMTRGYPFDTEKVTGQVVPWSESRLNTEQAAILIDTIQQFAAEYGIVLEG
jgi:hypothetical protein